MTEEEIYEELEITYGKPPRTTAEKNMIWLKVYWKSISLKASSMKMFQSQVSMHLQ